ncbi:hypothetical protein E2C01_073229 [Portunus trituberculatus]|uniref:Uncharacterized protein n=1 Tax=Portunus trituberculatus TaxID=210409 RepID=A0A5B7I4M6_PORTR|nr:hypothetical protein [Portunus trituberculatus]
MIETPRWRVWRRVEGEAGNIRPRQPALFTDPYATALWFIPDDIHCFNICDQYISRGKLAQVSLCAAAVPHHTRYVHHMSLLSVPTTYQASSRSLWLKKE